MLKLRCLMSGGDILQRKQNMLQQLIATAPPYLKHAKKQRRVCCYHIK
ncbi:MAG: hypothetical protein ACTS73_03585 [Arsenophonus sp. NEOnobi-MAG3]